MLPSGLFWTVELDDGAFKMSKDRKRATLQVDDVPLIDNFQFLGAIGVPATVSLQVKWVAKGPPVLRGSGKSAPSPTDPAAFLGNFSEARSTASISGREIGFSFRTNTADTDPLGYAEMGAERNGSFL